MIPLITPKTWEDYFLALPTWEKDLIDGVEFNSILEVSEALTSQETTIKIASDGGAAYDHGSYGWIICYSPEKIVARHKGVVRGYPIASRRAEAYGGLSLARFIYHVLCYFDLSFDKNINWYCDSRDVIKRFYDYSPTPWNHFSHKLQGDDDVIMQLHVAWEDITSLTKNHNSSSGSMQIVHVKSHQDDHKKV